MCVLYEWFYSDLLFVVIHMELLQWMFLLIVFYWLNMLKSFITSSKTYSNAWEKKDKILGRSLQLRGRVLVLHEALGLIPNTTGK